MGNFTYYFVQFFSLALVAIFLENTVLARALGASRAIALARQPRNILLYGTILTSIILLASCGSWALFHFFPDIPSAFVPISYIGLIGVIYTGLHFAVKRLHSFYEKVGYYLPVATFNCATLGSIFLSIHQKYTFSQFISFGLGTGIGFMLATYLIVNGMRQLNEEEMPAAFKGFPIMLIYIGILSLAMYSLVGHQLPF